MSEVRTPALFLILEKSMRNLIEQLRAEISEFFNGILEKTPALWKILHVRS